MSSLTVRQLEENVKKQLRVRAARHGRSVEEELRHILRSAATDAEAFATLAMPSGVVQSDASEEAVPSPAKYRLLLIIGGGIAAYKSLDLIRRLKDRGAAVRVVMTEAAQQFVTPLAAGALADGDVFTELF